MPNYEGTNMNGRTRSRRPKPLLIAITAALLLCAGVASASAASIEGVWSFQHGAIDVVPLANGQYEGIVTEPTTFASCTHEDNEPIWTSIKEQPGGGGSYEGFHQWFSANCQKNPVLGPTAWRVLTEPNGSYYLRVCFSNPGSMQQPTIAANGDPKEASEYAEYHVTYGCYSSEFLSPLPGSPGATGTSGSPGSSGPTGSGKGGVSGAKESLVLPSAKKCLSVRLFKIHLPNPKYDPFKTVTVTLKGRKIATKRKGNYVIATINLRRLPKGAFTIKISATTVLGHHLTASRTYHTCVKKIKPKKR